MHSATYSVPKLRDANLFIQTRARLQRLSDMKFFSGWVERMENTTVQIRLKPSKAVVETGDEFSVEVAGKEKTATFVGKAFDITGSIVHLELPRGVEYQEKKENARVSMFGYRGQIVFEGNEYSFTLVDISEDGMGLYVSGPLERGAIVEFQVLTPFGPIDGTGEVRYCRSDPENPTQYRSGILMKDLNRVERARWNHLLNEGAGG